MMMTAQLSKVRTLLLVEDEPDIRLLMNAYLRRDDRLKVIDEAVSAGEALEIVSANPPELIILDHSIEGDLMGLEAAPKLKALAPDCKILFFTAFNMSRPASAEPAIDKFLSKSDMPKLLETVQRLLGLEPR